jgi:hypothetical protein
MQPNQNPYDFLNTPTPKRGFGGATSQKTRTFQVIGVAAVLLIVFGIVFSFIFSSNSGPKKPLVEVAAAQADIIALTKDGDLKLRDSTLKADATMIKLTVTSQNGGTKTLLAAYGVGKDVSKQAKVYQDTTYVTTLKKATENNAYDTTYQKILADKVGVYRAKLNNAYNAVSSTSQKKQLSDYYRELELLAPSTATKN